MSISIPALLAAHLPLANITAEGIVIALLAGGLAYCFLAIADLRRRLEAIANKPAAAPAPATPAPLAAAAPAVSPTPASASPASGISPEVLSVIAAVVHRTLGSRYRLVSVAPAVVPVSAAWSVEGRREIFSSHQLR